MGGAALGEPWGTLDPSARPDRLALLYVHQRDSSLDARERLLALAADAPTRSDLVVVSTCHRVELYGALPAHVSPRDWFARRLTAPAGVGPLAEAPILVGAEAVRHLLRVACGLDSTVRGEGQILGQIRRTFDDARRTRWLDPLLVELFQLALHVGRELRATTALGTVRRSVGSLAVEEVDRLVPGAKDANALVIGAGEIGKLAARALSSRVGRVLILNRDIRRAETLADDIGGDHFPADAIDAALARAHVVISAADTRGTLLTPARLATRLRQGPLFVIDLAVPRSVEAAARELPGLIYRCVDDLAEGPGPQLEGALKTAEHRCEEEAALFIARTRGRLVTDTIVALQQRGEQVRRVQLTRALDRLGHLDERDRRIVEALSERLTRALLHAPTVALRQAPEHERAARELFDLSAIEGGN